jgi:hypothetical protein
VALVIAPASEKEVHGAAGPLALWLIIQLGVLALIVARVPLAAHFPVASETLAPRFVFAAQVITAALLFPFLLRDVRTAAQIVLSAVPFQLAAACLAGAQLRTIVLATLYVDAWLISLTLWSIGIRTELARLIAVAIASSLTLGAAALSYLRVEFNPSFERDSILYSAPPLPATWDILGGSRSISPWILLGSLMLIGAILVTRLQIRRATAARVPLQSA